MAFHLSRQAVLKWLETPSVYHLTRDELYELDQSSFQFLGSCASGEGCDSPDSAFVDYCLEEGLLTRESVSVQRPPLVPASDPSLRYLELQITSRCNLRCRHCYLGDSEPRELTVAQILNILKEFEDMQGLRVLITGGEPLLHSRFSEVNALFQDLSLRRVLFTNGLLLKKDVLRTLKVHEIQVSIDGMREAHDSVRGDGTWAVSIGAIRNAVDAGFDVSVSTMVHRGNLADFDAMDEFFHVLGVREWTVDVPCATGRLKENEELGVPPEVGGRFLGYGYGGGMHASGPGFACGLHLMAILPDGHAAKCTFYGDRPAGTVEEGLRACWERIQPVRLDDLDCDCEVREACRGGCRYRAELLGHPKGKDRYRCALYGFIDRVKEDLLS